MHVCMNTLAMAAATCPVAMQVAWMCKAELAPAVRGDDATSSENMMGCARNHNAERHLRDDAFWQLHTFETVIGMNVNWSFD